MAFEIKEYKGYRFVWSDWHSPMNNDCLFAVWSGYKVDTEYGVHAVVPFGGSGRHIMGAIFDYTLKNQTGMNSYITWGTNEEMKETWKGMGWDRICDIVDQIEKGTWKDPNPWLTNDYYNNYSSSSTWNVNVYPSVVTTSSGTYYTTNNGVYWSTPTQLQQYQQQLNSWANNDVSSGNSQSQAGSVHKKGRGKVKKIFGL